MNPNNISHGSLTEKEVVNLTNCLTRHYGEPVMPVSRYCQAFETWAKALQEKRDRAKEGKDNDYHTEENPDPLWRVADQVPYVAIAIYKSNLLSRLIYGSQRLRSTPCPKHKGHWSGYGWGKECECQDGNDITGWLPEE